MHIGMNACITDYLPSAARGVARAGLLGATVVSVVGLLKINIMGPGVTQTVKGLWHRPGAGKSGCRDTSCSGHRVAFFLISNLISYKPHQILVLHVHIRPVDVPFLVFTTCAGQGRGVWRWAAMMQRAEVNVAQALPYKYLYYSRYISRSSTDTYNSYSQAVTGAATSHATVYGLKDESRVVGTSGRKDRQDDRGRQRLVTALSDECSTVHSYMHASVNRGTTPPLSARFRWGNAASRQENRLEAGNPVGCPVRDIAKQMSSTGSRCR
ncbi:succinate dehydrogenase [ubiquinone] cytochrome b small subunit, partial [Haematococcus lacustris]